MDIQLVLATQQTRNNHLQPNKVHRPWPDFLQPPPPVTLRTKSLPLYQLLAWRNRYYVHGFHRLM